MQKFNEGGYQVASDNSSIGLQINDKHWSRAAVIEARKKKIWSQMGDRLTQPKHYGRKIVKYHNIPILDDRNVNDQGIDAAGVAMVAGEWYTYDTAGVRTAYATKKLAQTAILADPTLIGPVPGNGALYGSDKDMSTQKSTFPALTEEGGMVNRVGMKRETIEAEVREYGFYMSFTKESLDMDTETGLLARYATELGVAQGDVRESMIRTSIITQSEVNRTQAGHALNIDEINETSVLSFPDLRLMDQALNASLCPYDTKLIDGSTKVDTKTVAAARYVYCGPQMRPTLEDITHGGRDMWIPVEMYAAAGNIADMEIGKIGQFRFIVDQEMNYYEGAGSDQQDASNGGGPVDATYSVTDIGKPGGASYDVFPVVFVGSGSFATVGFQGDVARVKTIMPKADAHNDVYGKKGAVSISWYYGFMALRPEWMRQIICSASVVGNP